MATRFYFASVILGVPDISPDFDAGWEQTGGASRRKLQRKPAVKDDTTDNINIAIPTPTTQDILAGQFVGLEIPAQRISGTVSLVIKCSEANVVANCTLAVVIRVLSKDGLTVRGTLYSVFGTGTEFGTTASTRIVDAQAVTTVDTQAGDRLVVEIGARATSPTDDDVASIFNGYDEVSIADYALTSGLTTSLNGWIEFSQSLFPELPNNYKSVRAWSGISVTEKIR